jgi:hypothetical protein
MIVEDPVVVDEEPLGQAGFRLPLDLDVEVDDLGLAVEAVDPEELVGEAPAELGVPDHLRELLVEALVAPRPVDLGVDLREEKLHEIGKKSIGDLLPRAVVAVAWRTWGAGGRW